MQLRDRHYYLYTATASDASLMQLVSIVMMAASKILEEKNDTTSNRYTEINNK